MTSDTSRRYDCPPWCIAAHADNDHPDDRWHQAITAEVPAVFAIRDRASGSGRWTIEHGNIAIDTARHIGTPETITSIGRDGDLAALVLTPGSARRLVNELARHLCTIHDA